MRGSRLRSSLILAFSLAASCGFAVCGELAPATEQRLTAAGDAARVLLQTYLFRDGRGIHAAAPGLVPAYRFFQDRPGILNLNRAFGDQLGWNMEGGRAVGVFPTAYQGQEVLAFGCVGCHSGRAAGRLIVGLGNKRIDIGQMAALTHAIVSPYRWFGAFQTSAQWPLMKDTDPFTTLLGDSRWTNRTQGLVPIAMIQQWFYRSAGRVLPPGQPAGEVKVPQLWGYSEKRKAGLFCDGFGDGGQPGWAAMVELAAGQTPETVRNFSRELERIEESIEHLLPPSYPFAIDRGLASKGQTVFEQTCSMCHGVYRKDSEGLPVFQAPRLIPWDVVRTDPQRLRAVTPEFRLLVDLNPLQDLVKERAQPSGYFAPRLEGIWARFPYLHNASVPTIRDLLTPPSGRPTSWSLADSGELERFDAQALGLKLPPPLSLAGARISLRAAAASRDVYSTAEPGHSNQGHAVGIRLPDSAKKALIEYLKTL